MLLVKSDYHALYLIHYYISASAASFGLMFCGIIQSTLPVWLGCKKSILLSLPVGILSWIVLGTMSYSIILTIARFVQGLLIAVIYHSSCNYIVEIAHPLWRGRLLAILNIFLGLGFFYVSLVGSFNLSWRNVSFICGITTVVLIFIIVTLPESPRWLVENNRKDEALNSLIYYRGAEYNVQQELDEISEKKEKNTISDLKILDRIKLLMQKNNRKIFLIMLTIHIIFNYTGNLTTIVYSASIFELIENSLISPYIATALCNASRLVGVVVLFFISDKYEQKSIFILFVLIASLSTFLFMTFLYLQHLKFVSLYLTWLPIVSLMIYHFSIDICFSCLSLLRSELLPTSIRSTGVGIQQTFFSISTYSALYLHPIFIIYLGARWTFLIYAIASIIVATVVTIYLPHTKGKSLEEIAK